MITHIFDKQEFHLDHNLNPHFEAILSFKKRAVFESSKLFQEIKHQIYHITNGVEWKITQKNTKIPDKIRIVAWNVERGKNLEGMIDLFQNNAILSKADVLLLSETDIGMGRSGNRNVPYELASALEMNYCFANSYLVISKGDVGEQDHNIENSLSMHGISMLSKFQIIGCRIVPLYRVKDAFYSSEKRLGQRKGLICQIKIGGQIYDFAVTHLDFRASPKQRSIQMNSLLRVLSTSQAKAQFIGGDMNSSTYNFKNKFSLVLDILYKYFVNGFNKTVEDYMKPEVFTEKPLFDTFRKYKFNFDNYNDKSTGTLYYDLNKIAANVKSRQYLPEFFLEWLRRKLEPWDGCVPLRVDWFAGNSFQVIKEKMGYFDAPQVIEKPVWKGKQISDHNPIIVDLML